MTVFARMTCVTPRDAKAEEGQCRGDLSKAGNSTGGKAKRTGLSGVFWAVLRSS